MPLHANSQHSSSRFGQWPTLLMNCSWPSHARPNKRSHRSASACIMHSCRQQAYTSADDAPLASKPRQRDSCGTSWRHTKVVVVEQPDGTAALMRVPVTEQRGADRKLQPTAVSGAVVPFVSERPHARQTQPSAQDGLGWAQRGMAATHAPTPAEIARAAVVLGRALWRRPTAPRNPRTRPQSRRRRPSS